MISQLKARISPGLRGAAFYALYWGAVGMFEPFLNVFYLKAGLSGEQIGWMAAVLPFCTLVFNPFITRFADRLHRRVGFLALTMLGYSAALLALGLPMPRLTFPLLLGLVALISIFRGPVNPLADSLIAGMASRRQLDFGHMRLWGSIVFTVSAVALGALWQQTGFAAMFRASALFLLPVILAALLLEEPPAAQPVLAEKPRRGRLALDPGLLCLLGATFLLLAALFMAGTFGSIYVTQLGGSPALVGAMMGLAALGEVPGMLFGSRLARRMGDTNLLLLAYALIACGLAGYVFSAHSWTLLLFAVLRGVGFGAVLVSTVTILNNRAPKELASTYQGILSAACWGLAPLIGGPVSGWVYQAAGPLPFFLGSAVMALLGAALLLPTYKLFKYG